MSPKKMFIVSLLATIVVGFLCFSSLALAADDYGLFTTAKEAGLTKTGSGDLPTLAGNVLGTALSFIGVLFFALMVFGGFMWMTARGNEEQTKKALSTITAAVIGLIIVLSSYTITSFVFKSVGIQSTPAASTGTGTSANAECVAFNSSFTCTEITSCDGIATTTEFTIIEEKNAQGLCTANGQDKCKTGLCGKGTLVCCKPKTTAVNWCYVEADKVCKTQTALGSATCKSGNPAVKYYENSTEADCYTESLKGTSCATDEDCKKDVTKLVCNGNTANKKICTEAVKGAATIYNDSKKCEIKLASYINRDWITVSDASLGGQCNCNSEIVAGDVCANTSDCASGNFCVGGKCESGKACARCESESDCAKGYFCEYNSMAVTKTCFSKTVKGGKCDEDYHCTSGKCVDTNGIGGPDTCN
jgi:hypothetical protein